MTKQAIKRPTLPDSATRNPGVNPDQVAKYLKVVKTLRAHGVIEKPAYGIQPPLSGKGNLGQATQASTLRNV